MRLSQLVVYLLQTSSSYFCHISMSTLNYKGSMLQQRKNNMKITSSNPTEKYKIKHDDE